MNEFEKSQSAKILAIYGHDIHMQSDKSRLTHTKRDEASAHHYRESEKSNKLT